MSPWIEAGTKREQISRPQRIMIFESEVRDAGGGNRYETVVIFDI